MNIPETVLREVLEVQNRSSELKLRFSSTVIAGQISFLLDDVHELHAPLNGVLKEENFKRALKA